MKKNLGVFIAWVVIYAYFAFRLPDTFLHISNLELMMRQSVIIGLGAIGMAYVIMTGGIDLSAGSTIAATTMACAVTMKATNNPTLTILAGLAIGILCGAFNGTLVAKLKVGPFIVTLATMLVIRGVAKGIGKEQTINSVPESWINTVTSKLGPEQSWMMIPPAAWLWVILLILMSAVMARTVFGRNVVAIGSNERTAQLCGIKVDRVKIGVYTIGGLFAALAGLAQFARVGIGDPTIAQGDELRMIAAVVIGGGSLLGGEGSLLGAAFGTLIMTTINMGCIQLGVANWVQEIITGVIIVVAVALDRYRLQRAKMVKVTI